MLGIAPPFQAGCLYFFLRMPQMAKAIRPIPAAFVCKCNTIIRSGYYYRITVNEYAEFKPLGTATHPTSRPTNN